MKIRNGFVSNSSSSSFVIDTNKLNCNEKYILKYFGGVHQSLYNVHIKPLIDNNIELTDVEHYFDNIACKDSANQWEIDYYKEYGEKTLPCGHIEYGTYMDNFDLIQFLFFMGFKKEYFISLSDENGFEYPSPFTYEDLIKQGDIKERIEKEKKEKEERDKKIKLEQELSEKMGSDKYLRDAVSKFVIKAGGENEVRKLIDAFSVYSINDGEASVEQFLLMARKKNV